MADVEQAAGTDHWASIIRRARQLDAEAFDVVVDAYGGRLAGFFRRLTGDRDEADDLVQEVFVRVVRTIGDYHEDGRFEAWLFRIAGNLARDRLRQRRARPGHESLDALRDRGAACEADGRVFPIDRSPARGIEHDETMDRLQAAMLELTEPERVVILLRHYGQLSFNEIAEYMETPIGTALARAHRGLEKLRSLMESNQ